MFLYVLVGQHKKKYVIDIQSITYFVFLQLLNIF